MNPTSPVPLQYAEPATLGRGRRRRWFEAARWCAIVGWLACAVAWTLVLVVETRSVLATGPILLGVGVITFVAGILSRFRWAIITGTGQCLLCVTLFALVNLFRWSPETARGPFIAAGAAYIVLTAVPTIYIIAARCDGG